MKLTFPYLLCNVAYILVICGLQVDRPSVCDRVAGLPKKQIERSRGEWLAKTLLTCGPVVCGRRLRPLCTTPLNAWITPLGIQLMTPYSPAVITCNHVPKVGGLCNPPVLRQPAHENICVATAEAGSCVGSICCDIRPQGQNFFSIRQKRTRLARCNLDVVASLYQ